MKNKHLSKIFIIIGVFFIFTSVVLYFENYKLEQTAKINSEFASNLVLNQIKENIEKINQQTPQTQLLEYETQQPESQVDIQQAVIIDGNVYVGMLEIPALSLNLPVQGSWSYQKLRNSPCIYKNEPFSIMAHNYNSHFANIGKLKISDQVRYTNLYGEQTIYKVVAIESIHEIEVSKLNDFSYDLTLVTCNYNNNKLRTLVRLEKI